ncbi:MAG: hypothetical protein OXI87_16190 [Albidovulum sp.]|nr:hypothetical protein [Albidovulum sp.]MDE0306396.1 hypothetical protein [Albidovulum sp.]MDE0532208.1 hypothetical protein [Albidovulum sp.]
MGSATTYRNIAQFLKLRAICFSPRMLIAQFAVAFGVFLQFEQKIQLSLQAVGGTGKADQKRKNAGRIQARHYHYLPFRFP